ncbi:BppU family phage baseplate upper protein [Staphylococcus haemolyticus]|uniref:BppU family phage baseplate upper protein n=1 Tax=Staphylococcus haemolyticus TaxID=1283 RepID=UPI001F1C688E|nr:BppU family phage baseplate upper protein [Staphylococcus haemolyticus]MCE5035275.1 BppU family phage baseplate upper protein [Staphylococcus haemolyticus]MCE5049729.1 BppU family phage baseplate upper protein [Staphylococcus haemolyticus]
MADIYKTKEIETNINERGVNLGNVDVTLYTMDKGSAAFKIHLKREVNYGNEKVYDSVNLYTADMTPRIDIVAADGSVFSNEPIDIVIPENGVIQYIVSDYVIRHAGKMDVYIYLENKSESVQVANFYFYIEEDGVARRLGKEITGGRLEDVVKNVMSGQLMELLSEDFREQLDKEIKQFLSDNNKDFNLKFEDLTRDEKDELMKNLTNQGLADFRIEDNSILNEKLVDGTIQPEKTSFFDISNNLLNPETVKLNKTIDSSGNLIDDKNQFLSELIPFNSTRSISFTKGNYSIALYDENKEFYLKSGVTNSSLYTISANSKARYFRLSTALGALNTIMVNYGSQLLPFERFRKELKPEFIPNIDFDSLKNVYIGPDKLTNYIKSKNLFNKNNVMIGKTINSKGTLIDDSNYVVSSKIKVEGDKVAFSTPYSAKCIIYDKNDKMLGIFSKLSNQTTVLDLTKYPNAEYFVIIASRFVKDDFMANYGETVLPYEDFAYTLVTTDQYPIKISSDIIPKTLSGGTNTNNSSENVVNLNDLSNTQQLVKDNSASLNAGESLEVLNTTNKTQLDYIEFTSSAVDLELEITYTDKDGQKSVSNITKPDDNSKLPLTIENVVSYGYPNTDFLVYDVSRKLFKIAIKDLNFSNGVTIKLKNNGTSSINGSAKLVGRYYV